MNNSDIPQDHNVLLNQVVAIPKRNKTAITQSFRYDKTFVY